MIANTGAPAERSSTRIVRIKRISLGGSIARAALGFEARSVRELRDAGTIEFSAGQIAQGELNAMFAAARR